jgi:phosphate starvation-inducible protein PhoH and related proteins
LPTEEIAFSDQHLVRNIVGHNEENLRLIEKRLKVGIISRGNILKITGEEPYIGRAKQLLEKAFKDVEKGLVIDKFDFLASIDEVRNEIMREGETTPEGYLKIDVPNRKRYIIARTEGQNEYVKSLISHNIVIAIGPAGTGKTYLAMAYAVSALTRGEVSRIILTRPAVEAGENLGFLPGTFEEKINPYLRPLYDALYEMVGMNKIQRHIDTGIIEIAPLAYMRGRTLNDSFIILDEAQNTTAEQMRMFLTRMGFNSKVVVTGDITQVDLPQRKKSGLIIINEILQGIDGIRFCYFTERDVVRHELVQKIVRAYEKWDIGNSKDD